MDGKSSRNEEIRPLADFKDRTIPLRGAPADHAPPAASQSVIQPIHPIANFHDKAQAVDKKGTDAAEPKQRMDIMIDSDIAPYFPTAESVNEALRALVNIARRNGNSNAS